MKTEPTKPVVKPPLTPQSSLDSKAPPVTSSSSDTRPRADPWVEDQLTTSEMENVTTVFRYFETGLREATILPKVNSFNFHYDKDDPYFKYPCLSFSVLWFLFAIIEI